MNRRDFMTTTLAAAALSCAGTVTATRARRLDVRAFHAERRFAATPFGRIAYVERGAGPTAALFVHGLPLNGYQWRGALERLAPLRRCLAPDSMGLGYSEIPEGQALAPNDQVAMLVAFLDALRIDAVDLVASDSGGAVAQIFVARHPRRVRTLLLTNCDVHEDSPPPALAPVIADSRAGTFADAVLAPQLADKSKARLPDGLGGICYQDPAALGDETIECYLRPLVSTPLRKAQLHRYIVALAENPLLAIEPALRRSEVPLRVVWGTADTLFAASSPDWLDRAFPRSRGVRRVDGAKLFFPEEQPDLIAEETRGLWLSA